MRTQEQLKAAKRLLKNPPGKLTKIDLSNKQHPKWMTRAYANNHYVVMINDYAMLADGTTAIKAMIQRHDDKPIPFHWREMQNIKNQLFGNDTTAIEYYPPACEVVDVANIYWLWIFPDGVIPKPINP